MIDDAVARAAHRYRTASAGPSGEYPEKTQIVAYMESLLPSPAARAFLLHLLRTSGEYGLARIEVCRILEVRPLPELGDAEECVDALLGVIEQDDDELVCQWAARALRNFASSPRVVDAAIRVVRNHSADLDVRHNALAAIWAAHLEPRQAAALETVLADPELRSSVERVLARRE